MITIVISDVMAVIVPVMMTGVVTITMTITTIMKKPGRRRPPDHDFNPGEPT